MGESVSVQDRGKEWQKQVGSWRRVQTEQPLWSWFSCQRTATWIQMCNHSGFSWVQTWCQVELNWKWVRPARRPPASSWSGAWRPDKVLCNNIEIVVVVREQCINAGNRRLAGCRGRRCWDSAKLRPDWAVEEARELRVHPAWKLRSCGRMLISWWNLKQAGAKVSGGYRCLAVCLLSGTA